MKLGVVIGALCIGISLGLIYLDNNFKMTDYYFKGIILGVGIGFFTGTLYGYISGKKASKYSLSKKQDLSIETSPLLDTPEEEILEEDPYA